MLISVVGSIVVTMIVNVPMNDALAAADPNSAAGATQWADYLSRWTLWNHVRGIATLAATAAFIAALR